jgi:hypothetical protein
MKNRLSLEEEKYLNKLNRMNALEIIDEEAIKCIDIIYIEDEEDYMIIEKQIAMIDAVLKARMIKN